jgi:hypothetical protein
MSIERFGTVDIDCLWNLRKAKGDEHPRFQAFDERADVVLVGKQNYHAVVGTEYLASNPTEFPEMASLIRSCTEAASDVVFNQLPTLASTDDPFQTLSPELRLILLEMLEKRDVANLRLSSKTFSQLPRTFFRQLIGDEMPWVWELGCLGSKEIPREGVDWFTLWNKLSAADGETCLDEKTRAENAQVEGDRSHALAGEAEIRGLRNRRIIYRDIGIILDIMAEAKGEQAR